MSNTLKQSEVETVAGVRCPAEPDRVSLSTVSYHLQPEGLEKCIKLNLVKHLTKWEL